MKRLSIVILLTVFSPLSAFGQRANLKLKDLSTSDGDTSILIQKGVPNECTQYQIVDGNDSVMGDPDYDRAKAYSSWKSACSEWKVSMRQLNAGNSLIMMNCGAPTLSRADSEYTYQSTASYKVRVKIREAADMRSNR